MATAHDSPTVALPLEWGVHAFDDLFQTSIQGRRFRDYLAGLLLPRDRNKILTALVGAEPLTQVPSSRRRRSTGTPPSSARRCHERGAFRRLVHRCSTDAWQLSRRRDARAGTH